MTTPRPPLDGGARVLVMGASVAGMLAAAALAPHPSVRLITLLDRDEEPSSDPDQPLTGRKGTPQDSQLHGLLCAGRDAIEQLLPGFTLRFEANGALASERMSDFMWHHTGGWLPVFNDRAMLYQGTRPALERTLRALLLERFPGKVHFAWSSRVSGLAFDQDADAVVGVRMENGALVPSDLVVDAMGASSPTTKWVCAQGYAEPPTLEYVMDMGYSTMHWMLPPADDPSRKNFKTLGCLVFHNPGESINRGACVIKTGACAVPGGVPDPTREYALGVAFGFGEQRPHPESAQDWLDYVACAATPAVREYLCGATPISQPMPFSRPKQVWRRFDQLASWPARLVSVGDAVACLNPAYGQGMTLAALGAARLRRDADQLVRGDTLGTQRAVASAAWFAFMLNAAEDTKMASTKGFALPGQWLVHRIVAVYARAAAASAVVAHTLLRVAHLQASPVELVHPSVLARVVWATLPSWRGPSFAAKVWWGW